MSIFDMIKKCISRILFVIILIEEWVDNAQFTEFEQMNFNEFDKW